MEKNVGVSNIILLELGENVRLDNVLLAEQLVVGAVVMQVLGV